jgi:hypothetical protein
MLNIQSLVRIGSDNKKLKFYLLFWFLLVFVKCCFVYSRELKRSDIHNTIIWLIRITQKIIDSKILKNEKKCSLITTKQDLKNEKHFGKVPSR